MISVCIATHNGEKYIKKQLESILSQLDFSDEIVISDDGSTDQTINLIQSLEDKRIKIFTYKQCFDYSKLYLSSYYYATANFHNALRHAQGEIIFLADQDDIWVENRVSVFMKVLEKADFVTSNFSIIDEMDELIEELYYDGNPYAGIQNKIIQAMGSGKCVVTTPIGAEGLIIKGEIAIEKNDNDMAERIIFLLSHKDVRCAMGKDARKYVQQNLSFDAISQQFYKLVTHLL